MRGRRVVVTGIGCIAPCGIGKDALLAAMRGSRSFIRRVTRFDASPYASQVAGEVDGFVPADAMDRRDAERLSRASQFAVAAAREAVADAGLLWGAVDPARIGVSVGIASGGLDFFEAHHELALTGAPRVFGSHYYPALGAMSPSAAVARLLGTRGATLGVSTGCTAGVEAIGYSFRQIRTGRADVMIAGGSDAPLTPLIFSSFTLIKALSTHRNDKPEEASRPFDKHRDGFVMGEGGGMIVLEDLDHALRRGARVYMEVAGYGTTLNAHHMTAPLPEGVETARAITLALKDGGVPPEEVDYISAHGSSTRLNEEAETRAFKIAFGEQARRLCVSSLKSMLGHPFGAAGGHQAAAAALTFAHDLIPPTVNLDTPDPECDLDNVPWESRRMRVRAMVQNSCGFSGKNAALVYRRYEPPAASGQEAA